MRESASTAAQPDTLILGAGIIGLSLALELRTRGRSVAVLDPSPPLTQASTAAAGMLAVEDPHNPPELLPLSRLSGSLYAAFLERVKELSGIHVPFQTETTWQILPSGRVRRLAEHSIDPRQLAPALLAAVRAAGVLIRRCNGPECGESGSGESGSGESGSGEPEYAAESFAAAQTVVHTTGAWGAAGLPLSPRKGQMLRVELPAGSALKEVYRSEGVYVVPRTHGPQAGTALIGATVEDAGFDLTTSPSDLEALRQLAAALVPDLADARAAPRVEAWAGLRPATPDGLPVLGIWEPHTRFSAQARHFVAAGHFRNGILLAPATAVVMADLIDGRPSGVDLSPFAASRFAARP